MRRWALLIVPSLLFVPLLGAALAVDHPLTSGKLDIKRHNGKEQVTFSSKDTTLLFPAIGSPDDPGTGAPGGALIEILSAAEPTVSFTVPAGTGKPGWAAKPGTHPRHAYSNTAAPSGPSPIKKMQLRDSKVVDFTSKLAGLAMTTATTRVAVRITTGSIRNCIAFEGLGITKNDPTRLKAQKKDAAVPPQIPDCTDASLLGLPSTCGESAHPTCNGECPPGDECAAYGPPGFGACGCIPAGSAPCGTPGIPTCGGSCPSGQSCGAVGSFFGSGCTCGIDCGNGFIYSGAPQEGVPFSCYPILCGSDYPTCSEDPCGDGGTCSPFTAGNGAFTGCICAVAMPCGAGGYECAPGDVCTINGVDEGCGPPS